MECYNNLIEDIDEFGDLICTCGYNTYMKYDAAAP